MMMEILFSKIITRMYNIIHHKYTKCGYKSINELFYNQNHINESNYHILSDPPQSAVGI